VDAALFLIAWGAVVGGKIDEFLVLGTDPPSIFGLFALCKNLDQVGARCACSCRRPSFVWRGYPVAKRNHAQAKNITKLHAFSFPALTRFRGIQP
jgi:hypothetical protein